MGKFYFFVLKLFGWKIDPIPPAEIKKAVVVMGPHTSNWDFLIGYMAFRYYKVKAKYLIKKDLFFFPLGLLLKAMGGIPVDRKKNNNVTKQAVDYLNSTDTCAMVFTPEGTRSYQPNWKKGFYFIAHEAKVPIFIGYLDYERKIGGFHSLFEPTGDVDKDIQHIKSVLSQFKGRFPEQGIKAE